jgi:mono/diheme cytochrome c family protein
MMLLVATLTACGSEARPDDQWPISKSELMESATDGDPREATYRRYCVGCHGADGKGNAGLTGADFTNIDGPLRVRTDAELIASVRNGKRGVTATMPAHSPVLSDAQIAAVVSFVRERFAPAAAVPDATAGVRTTPQTGATSATAQPESAAPQSSTGGLKHGQ